MPTAPASSPETKSQRFLNWRRVLSFCLAIFAFELGVFLVVFPWLDKWNANWVPIHYPRFFHLWMSRYLRGALSGLGFVNIYIAFAELAKQLKSIFGE